jgi:DnaJ homolog subfamily C member 19
MSRIVHPLSKVVMNRRVYNNQSLIQNTMKNHLMMNKRHDSNLIIGGLAVAGTAIGLQYAIQFYNSMPSTSSEQPEKVSPNNKTEEKKQQSTKQKEGAKQGEEEKKKESFFASWFSFSKSFYDGGFEDKMTKREAALILGVRESSNPDRIKEAHRRILLLNHPDRGGSAYVAAKVNEAKDLLLKGKQ